MNNLQPVSSYQHTIGTGAGTAVLKDTAGVIHSVFWGGTYIGTAILYDSATAAGTSAANRIITLGLPLAQYPESILIDVNCRSGIVFETTGTPAVTVAWN